MIGPFREIEELVFAGGCWGDMGEVWGGGGGERGVMEIWGHKQGVPCQMFVNNK